MSAVAEQIKGKATAGIYVGRLNPMHLGHQAMVEGLMTAFGEKHLLLIGSCNQPISVRHMFNYADRTEFIRTVFPKVKIAPLPDFDHDKTWFQALDDLIAIAGIDPATAVYVGGSREDVDFYYANGRNVEIINRFNGPTVKVSGEEIRDSLMEKRAADLHRLLDPRIIPLVEQRFAVRWQEIRKK